MTLFINQLIQIVKLGMNIHIHILKTPPKREEKSVRRRPNVSTLTYSNINKSKVPQVIINQTVQGNPTRTKVSQRLHTQPICEARSTEADPIGNAIFGDSPSLKTQKRQYLKLFTTATTNKQPKCSENASNQSVHGSKQSEELNKASSGKSSKGDQKQAKFRRKLTPRRRLFGGIIIEREERIMLDSLDNEGICEEEQESTIMKRKEQHGNILSKQHKDQQTQNLPDPSALCHGCVKFLPKDAIYLHYKQCPPLQDIHTLNPVEKVQLVKRTGLDLIRRIEKQSDSLCGLSDHCSAFLKQCDLAWSAGRPSEIYSFKLKELQASSGKLAACMDDIHRLNLLLSLRQAWQKSHLV